MMSKVRYKMSEISKMEKNGAGGGRWAAQRGDYELLPVRELLTVNAKRGYERDRGGTTKASPKGQI
ncbi:hypothetical protein AN958_07273 [Leucoagaricus sp. SymC.cos]|nr:hypothetical protein AN958_07273 [Leucoagaricus sp. SymC.cos]